MSDSLQGENRVSRQVERAPSSLGGLCVCVCVGGWGGAVCDKQIGGQM